MKSSVLKLQVIANIHNYLLFYLIVKNDIICINNNNNKNNIKKNNGIDCKKTKITVLRFNIVKYIPLYAQNIIIKTLNSFLVK